MADLILYDGVCGLCNRAVQAILRRDREARFRFAALQGAAGQAVLRRHALPQGLPETIVVVVGWGEPRERVLLRSSAVLYIARKTGGWWTVFQAFGRLPESWLDRLYDLIARRRYRWFGKLDACPVPEERYRDRFPDL